MFKPERSQPADLAAAEADMEDHLEAETSQDKMNVRRARQKQARRQKRVNRVAVGGSVLALGGIGAAGVELGGQALDRQAHEVMKSRAPITKSIERNKAEHVAGEVSTGDLEPEAAPSGAVTSSVELDSPTPEDQTVVIASDTESADTEAGSQTGGLASEDTPDTGGVSATG